jgi:HNH endonuclease
MAEYQKDPEKFLKLHKAGPSLKYDLLDDEGRKYPPAAIAQAALGWSDIKGGMKARDSAGRALKVNGFRVITKGARLTKAPTDLEKLLKRLERIENSDRIVKAKSRIGSELLREFAKTRSLTCEVTGCADELLLRVSHIVAWSDDEVSRLNPENIILLSALWDAAFDKGLVSFGDNGIALYSSKLSKIGRQHLSQSEQYAIIASAERIVFLELHRKKFGFQA